MPYYVTSSVACLFVPNLSQLSCKRHDFRGKKLHSTVFWFPLQLLLENFFFISGRIQRDLLVNALMSLCKVQETLLQLYTHFNKDTQNKIPWKSVQWEPSRSIRTDGRTDGREEERTDTKKLICSFYKCANAPKIEEMGQLSTASPTHVNLLMLLAITFIP